MLEAPIVAAVRQPRAAAIAGIAFGVILTGVLALLQSATPGSLAESGTWMTDYERREAVSTALALIPFAGIAFLWFLAVVRSTLGHAQDRFFDTIFTASALIFVAMLFAAAAVLMAALSLAGTSVQLDQAGAAAAWALASALLGSFGARMAAVFVLSVCTAVLRNGSLPRPLVVVGYATGLLLLCTPPLPRWAQLLFPLWVIAVSVQVLVRERSLARARL